MSTLSTNSAHWEASRSTRSKLESSAKVSERFLIFGNTCGLHVILRATIKFQVEEVTTLRQVILFLTFDLTIKKKISLKLVHGLGLGLSTL